ncbi:MAG: thioredoxin fold domain-containing protein [Balneolaceae bacterium]
MKKPLAVFTVTMLSAVSLLSAQQVETVPVSLKQALEEAASNDKKILVDVYAEWCPYCERMHTEVYPSNEVLEAISDHFVWVKINIESEETVNYLGNEMTEAEFAQALQNKNVPTTYFLNPEGSIIGTQPGFIPPDTFSDLLNFVGSDAYLGESFEEYRNR